INVNDRDYFSKAKDGELWELDGGHKFYVESINSRFSGEKLAVISTPVQDGKWILCIGTRLLSLFDPILPPGYGFVLIDDEGTALFHSDSLQNKEVNLFKECNDSRQLQAAVLARSSSEFDTDYLGRDHHFYVRPVKGAPWTVVAFRDKQTLRTVNLQTLIHWLLLLLVFGLIQFLVVWLIFLPAMRKHSAWLWPDEEHNNLYCVSALLSAIVAALFPAALAPSSGCVLVLCAV